MYAYLKGKLTWKSPAQVHIEVNGVGYEVNVSLNTYSAVQSLDEAMLYTHLQVKEDGHVLFGFFDKEEKDIFLMLISVSGIGAGTARMMLSSLRPDEISKAILEGNVALLERVKGIGKKTAERLVLELKDKLSKHAPATGFSKPVFHSVDQDALQALIALGIGRAQAEQAIQKTLKTVTSDITLEELIKKSLKAI